MKQIRLLFLFSVIFSLSALTQNTSIHQFMRLPYSFDALEPHFDAQTMEIHYSRHHRGYYDAFIGAISGTDMQQQSLETIFAGVSKASPVVRNAGGGYYNHNLFWTNLSPAPGPVSKELEADIIKTFGSMEAFKNAFAKAAASVFGSGWAWLIVTADGSLAITTTPNQDNPLMDVVAMRGTPLIAFDVWEHAYYLKYQNRRIDYITSFWHVLDWSEVSRRYQKSAGK